MTAVLCVSTVFVLAHCGPGSTRATPGAASGEEGRRQQETPCVSQGADSTAVARAATAAANQAIGDGSEFLELRVVEFVSDAQGTLVQLLPGRRDVLGGGARVWVPKGGCAVVQELIE